MAAPVAPDRLEFSVPALGKLVPFLESPQRDTTYVPQANDLDRILAIVRGLGTHHATKSQVAARFEIDPRQALYYVEATGELGLTHEQDGAYGLSEEGRAMCAATEPEALQLIGGAILKLPVIRESIRAVISSDNGVVSQSKFEQIVKSVAGSRYNDKTVSRRAECVVSWLHWLENSAEFLAHGSAASGNTPDLGKPERGESIHTEALSSVKSSTTGRVAGGVTSMASSVFIRAATDFHKFNLPSGGFGGKKYDVWAFYADVNYLKGEPIPIYANVRKPALNTVAAEAIQDTLKSTTEAARFWAYNGGLVILAEQARKKAHGAAEGLELDIPQRYGLVNGGHTQKAIDAALKSVAPTDAWVRVEAIVGEFTDEEIAAIAEARNTSKNVKDMSLAWKEGKFRALQKRMRPDLEVRIDWTENQRASEGRVAACTATELVQILMLFDMQYDVNNPPKDYVRSLGRPFQTWWEDPLKFAYLDVVCDDILDLHDEILSTFHSKPAVPGLLNCAWGGKQVFPSKYVRPTPFRDIPVERKMDDGILFPILSAFRVLLNYDASAAKVRWEANPVQTWAGAKGDMMDQVKDSVLSHKSALQVRYDWNLWKGLGLLVEKHKTGGPTPWHGI